MSENTWPLCIDILRVKKPHWVLLYLKCVVIIYFHNKNKKETAPLSYYHTQAAIINSVS